MRMYILTLLLLCVSLSACGGTAMPDVEETDQTAMTVTPAALPTVISVPSTAPPTIMILVPAGPFTMGSDTDAALTECLKFEDDCSFRSFEDEKPIHTVTLDTFYIDQYEVTNAQYRQCNEAGDCQIPGCADYEDEERDDHPVICVTWDQANRYCRWRDARLPTEAEWEKAARGTDERVYPWGDTFEDNRTNFCDRNCEKDFLANKDYDDGSAETAPIGSYSNGVSPYGAYDMAGNVWEWVGDWYDTGPGSDRYNPQGYYYYANSPAQNPQGPDDGDFKVIRGGGWFDNGYAARTANRRYLEPDGLSADIGFRCVATVPK